MGCMQIISKTCAIYFRMSKAFQKANNYPNLTTESRSKQRFSSLHMGYSCDDSSTISNETDSLPDSGKYFYQKVLIQPQLNQIHCLLLQFGQGVGRSVGQWVEVALTILLAYHMHKLPGHLLLIMMCLKSRSSCSL